MPYNVEINGAQYNSVPSVEMAKVGGGTAVFRALNDGLVYDIIEDGRSSNTAGLVGTCSFLTEVKNGTRILYHLAYATAASTTLNLTLVGGTTTGAKKVYRQGTTQLAASIGIAGCVLPLTYFTALDSGNGGWMMDNSYDSNTNTIGYQLRTNSTILPVSDACRYYKILFTSADNKKWVPAAASTTNSATSAKTVNQKAINPFGRIVYCASTTSYAANADIGATTVWDQYNLTLGYSFNRTGAALTLTTKTPVYIKCAPQSDGSAIIDSDNPFVQTLPSTEDGKIYIFLGVATSATQVELTQVHPIYYYKSGAIRLWTNAASSGGGCYDTLFAEDGEGGYTWSGTFADLSSALSANRPVRFSYDSIGDGEWVQYSTDFTCRFIPEDEFLSVIFRYYDSGWVYQDVFEVGPDGTIYHNQGTVSFGT